jgi:aminopeptidase N
MRAVTVGIAAAVLVAAAIGTRYVLGTTAQPAGPARVDEPAAPEIGIALGLAQDRAARISDLRYAVALRIPADKAAPIEGEITATFALASAGAPVAFDFDQPATHVHGVSAGGHAVTARFDRGHLVIPGAALVVGANRIEIGFVAGDEPLHRGADFLYSLFVPARASHALPCFDQPDLKARWQLSLRVPHDWVAVGNGQELARTPATGGDDVRFAETAPLPTYLFAFAAGRFQIETAERNGRTFRMFHRETDAAKVARNRDAIFDLQAHALAWLEDYTQILYPFGKFDIVLIPAFQFGGMEHAGAIDYNADSLLLDETATQTRLLGRAELIAHETAHMWFGDLVTMRWFNDVWMKEVFANFMAAKIVNPSFPEVDHDLRFVVQHYPSAYSVDRTAGANPIRQELANLNEAGSLYGRIIYDKAPIVMRQLEVLLGADQLRAGLRRYLAGHRFGNASWPELIDIVRDVDRGSPQPSGIDFAAWSHAWVETRGRPTITTEIDASSGKLDRLSFVQSGGGDAMVWPQRLQVAIGLADGIRRLDVTLAGARTEVAAAAGLAKPRWVLPVGGGIGYGDFVLDAGTIEALLGSLREVGDGATRAGALVALWEAMLDRRVPPRRLLATLMVELPREPDELVVALMLDDVRGLFWRFLPPAGRAEVAPALEALLQGGLERAGSPSRKAAWFDALRGVATTAATLDWLERVWHREVAIAGLPLAETDETNLALELAVRDRPGAEAILAAQEARITNPDRKARLAFLRPALSSDAAVRDRLFASLKDVANRRHESWVLEAMRWLNHPLRAGSSQRYVVEALALVREIQRTGDIFFPKAWSDAALSGYQAREVAAAVQRFIDELPPDYPERLRWIVVSAADPVFRAAAIVE